ncbi:MAG: class I SAM-dependent methyltransferase [Planctomycetes bacterium]|nr:class I SAM-dependent methyltransferase [Planctomycetota bacterium]
MLRRTILGVAIAAVPAGASALAAQPGGGGGPGPGFRPGRGTGAAPPVENKPLGKSDAEKKILEVLDDMDRNQRRGMMNVPTDDGRLLRVLAESCGAKQCVEIGTSNGYSAVWTCLGLLNTGGKLVTHEIDAERAKLARENFKRAGVDGIVTLVEGDAHKEIAKLKGPIDFAFLDADKEGYADYLKQLLPLLRPGGLMLAHNVGSQAGPMLDYLKAATTSPDLETIFANLQGTGISITLKKR